MFYLESHDETRILLGMRFLDSFYQVYDLSRNQMAMVPSIYRSDDLNQPEVLVRNPFYIMISCISTLYICVLALASFNAIVGSSKKKLHPVSEVSTEFTLILLE